MNNLSSKEITSSLKQFYELLNVKDPETEKHKLTHEEKLYEVESYLLNSRNDDGVKIEYSSPDKDLQDLLIGSDYIEPIFKETQSDCPHEPLAPNKADDLLWFGGSEQEQALAKALGVTRIVIRTDLENYDLSRNQNYTVLHAWKDPYELFWIDDDDEKYINRHEWVMIIDQRLHLTSSWNTRTVRFDYLAHDHKGNTEILFSRYFADPIGLNQCFWKTYRKIKIDKIRRDLFQLSEEVHDAKH